MSLEAHRNDLAHGLYGRSRDAEDGIVWVNPRHRLNSLNMLKKVETEPGTDFWEPIEKETFLYDLSCLTRMACEMKSYLETLELLTHFVENEATRDEDYAQLCLEPRIQAELSKLHEEAQ